VKTGVILDTDIGYDPDDMIALLLLLNSPELSLNLVVTGDEVQGKRAAFARKILDLSGRKDIKVAQGASLGNTEFVVDEFLDDYQDGGDTSLAAIKEVVDASDKVIYIGIQGFTNLAQYLQTYPSDKKKLQVFQMGGAVNFSRREGWVEHNVKIDIPSAAFVLSSGVDIALVMAQTTFNPVLRIDNQHVLFRRFETSNNNVLHILTRHIAAFHEFHVQHGREFWPFMHDPLTVAAALGKDFVSFYDSPISTASTGELQLANQGENVHISNAASQDHAFMEFLEHRLFQKQ